LPIALTTVRLLLTGTASLRISVAATVAVGLTVGAIDGWFDRAGSGAERVVFVLGAIARGRRCRISSPPLAVGLIMADLGAHTRPADRVVTEDFRRVQHPLIVLLLLTAGALWSRR
jgi:hypothetical protein